MYKGAGRLQAVSGVLVERKVPKRLVQTFEALTEAYPSVYGEGAVGFADFLTQLYAIAQKHAACPAGDQERVVSELFSQIRQQTLAMSEYAEGLEEDWERAFNKLVLYTATLVFEDHWQSKKEIIQYIVEGMYEAPGLNLDDAELLQKCTALAVKAYCVGARDAVAHCIRGTRNLPH